MFSNTYSQAHFVLNSLSQNCYHCVCFLTTTENQVTIFWQNRCNLIVYFWKNNNFINQKQLFNATLKSCKVTFAEWNPSILLLNVIIQEALNAISTRIQRQFTAMQSSKPVTSTEASTFSLQRENYFSLHLLRHTQTNPKVLVFFFFLLPKLVLEKKTCAQSEDSLRVSIRFLFIRKRTKQKYR